MRFPFTTGLIVFLIFPVLAASSSHARGFRDAPQRQRRRLHGAAADLTDPDLFHGQIGQDRWVNSVHPSTGFYLDIGARDGSHISNTWALDKLGWKGICVEPLPEHFENRTCTLLEVVASNVTGTVKWVQPPEDVDPGLAGMQATLGDHWLHKEVLANNRTTVKEVNAMSMEDILHKNNAPYVIDYWSLDSEGSELMLLQAFPFREYHLSIVTVEHAYEEPKRTLIQRFLESKGFVRVLKNQYDDYYINRDDLKLHQRVRHAKGSTVWAMVLVGMLGTFCWYFRHTLR